MQKPQLILFLLIWSVATLSFAQAPANDDCANAVQVFMDQSVEFTTVGATTDGPNHMACFGDNDSIPADVWFYFVATDSMELAWTNCATANFDSRVAVYLAAPGDCPLSDAQVIDCNDDAGDACTDNTSIVEFEVVPGQTYMLRMGGFWGDGDTIPTTGSGTVLLELAPDRPENDDCEDALPVFLGIDQEFNTETASTDGPDHPDNPCFGFNSLTADKDLWYDFTPNFSGFVEWATCDNVNFDTRLAIYGPNVSCPVTDADLYACNDDGADCENFSSKITFEVEAGQTYKLRVGGWSGESGFGTFDLSEVIPPVPPANDTCDNAEEVFIIERNVADDFNTIFEGTTTDATFINENYIFPICLGNQDGGEFADVWYKFNSLGNETIEVRLNAEDEGGIFYLDLFEACGTMVDTSAISSICLNTFEEEFVVDTLGIFPAEETEYFIRVTTRATSDPTGPFWFQLVADIFTDVEETQLEGFSLFPNPATEQLNTTFSLEKAARVNYQIFNMLGQQVYFEDTGMLAQGEHQHEMNIANLPEGIYLLNITVDEKQKTVKFTKY